ncbi:MAG: class I SAM-dependent methyltransferase [Candidatus Contendobacter sp.]|nr:class I SAM-dependent methyltransferase [Candidatus Contendobacter sp.]
MNVTDLLNLPPSAGALDVLTVADGHLLAVGWVFQPGHTFECIEAYLDGKPVGPVRSVSRPDVEEAFGWVKDAKPSPFVIETSLEGTTPTRLDLIGRIGKAPAARLSCLIPSEANEQLPQPPDPLQERVSGLHGPAFLVQGLQMFTDLTDQMNRLGIPAAGRILDWGCGCGRVTRHFMTRLPEAKIFGCDIDSQAIEWCRQNLGAGFIHIEPMPPTPFKDAEVDIIIACSVLTHLAEAVQDRWLREMRRILAPGGHFLASTHGDYAFQFAHRGSPVSKTRSIWKGLVGADLAPGRLTGIQDSQLDPMLDGIAPPGYYRGVFQSRDHTVKACSKYFQVLDYVEQGLNGHQDLIILRRPK